MNKIILLILLTIFLQNDSSFQKYPSTSFYDFGSPFHFSSYYAYPYACPRINELRTRYWMYNS